MLTLTILLLGTIFGFIIGTLLPQRFALVFICLVDASVLSMVVYSFLMSFAGTWIVLLISALIFSVICTVLPLKFDQQMRIQSTSFLGAWSLTRGVSLMVGGYPNELQMIQWMHLGYVVTTSDYFFVYLVSMCILYLIGQRTQRTQWKREQQQESDFQQIQQLDVIAHETP